MKLELTSGAVKTININKFDAMSGWDIQRRYVEFVLSKDTKERTAFTMQVLSYASIPISGSDPIPLRTPELISNHLEDWKGVKAVFDQVLRENGIDPETHAEKEHYWSYAGAEFAASFITEVTKILGPILEAQQAKE